METPAWEFGVYIHFPFCVAKCPYCDFNSYGIQEIETRFGALSPLMVRYQNALIQELTLFCQNDSLSAGVCTSIFLGGGTPSLFPAQAISEILEALRSRVTVSPQVEVTLEANPGNVRESLSSDYLAELAQAGVNRLSFGCQSIRQPKLDFLGRWHTPGDVFTVVERVKDAGAFQLNIDLIYGVAGESVQEWSRELKDVLTLNPDHLSAYTLTIEPGTEFGRRAKRGYLLTVEEEEMAQMYELTDSILAEGGFARYEISNHAKAGRSCKHNLGYWRGRSYLGLGAGAHGFFNTESGIQLRRHGADTPADSTIGIRYSNIPGPNHYIERLEREQSPVQKEHLLTEADALLEFFLPLRMAEGLSLNEFSRKFGKELPHATREVISDIAARGLLVAEDGAISLTPSGFLLHDAIVSELTLTV